MIDYLESLFHKYPTWCPHCYEMWRTAEQVIYTPLIWLLSDIKFCPLHQVRLINQCPFCQSYMLNFSRPGYCSRCHQWLGQRVLPQNLADDFESNAELDAYQRQVSYWQEFIAMAPALSSVPTSQKLFVYLHSRCHHLEQSALKELSFSLWLRSKYIYNPNFPRDLVRPGSSIDFIFEVCELLQTSPKMIFL